MFERMKAKRIVENTISDVKRFVNELPNHDVFLPGGIDEMLISSLFIAFADYYAYIHKHSDLGDMLVTSFLKKVEFPELYRNLLVDTHKDYHQIVKKCVEEDNSADGLSKGYVEISHYIGEKLYINRSKLDVYVIIDSILCQRMADIIRVIE